MRFARLLLLLGIACCAAPAHSQSPHEGAVPLPILQARIVDVTSLDTRGPCSIQDLDLLLTPDTPTFTIDTGCTEVTVQLDGNRIVTTRVPGGEDYYVSFRELVIEGIASDGPYVPILISQRPGQSSRLYASYDFDGETVLDAAGTSHPTCDCSYTFAAPSGRNILYARGITVVRDDEHVYLEVSALVGSGPADEDGDGVDDADDRCKGTPAGAAVDAKGCSQLQFCEASPTKDWKGALSCAIADWRADEPGVAANDCGKQDGHCSAIAE